jgi:hypothetical protein
MKVKDGDGDGDGVDATVDDGDDAKSSKDPSSFLLMWWLMVEILVKAEMVATEWWSFAAAARMSMSLSLGSPSFI